MTGFLRVFTCFLPRAEAERPLSDEDLPTPIKLVIVTGTLTRIWTDSSYSVSVLITRAEPLRVDPHTDLRHIKWTLSCWHFFVLASGNTKRSIMEHLPSHWAEVWALFFYFYYFILEMCLFRNSEFSSQEHKSCWSTAAPCGQFVSLR